MKNTTVYEVSEVDGYGECICMNPLSDHTTLKDAKKSLKWFRDDVAAQLDNKGRSLNYKFVIRKITTLQY